MSQPVLTLNQLNRLIKDTINSSFADTDILWPKSMQFRLIVLAIATSILLKNPTTVTISLLNSVLPFGLVHSV